MANPSYICGPLEAKLIQEFCSERHKKKTGPCKSCKYRTANKGLPVGCIFTERPKDWRIF